MTDSVISFEETAPGADEFAARIERISATHPWLVAELDGRIAGFAYGSPHRERAAYRWAADVSVYVSTDLHRRGLGRALYETLLQLLADQGIQIACAGITLPNDASVALHEALAFRRIGIYRRIGFKAGAWRDVGWWQRQLLRPEGGAPETPGSPRRLS